MTAVTRHADRRHARRSQLSSDLSDPGSVSGTGSVDSNFDRSSSAQITGTSNGVAKSHTMRFTWSAIGDQRMPASSAAATKPRCAWVFPRRSRNQTAGTYGPGSPGNRPQARRPLGDGHTRSLCGNGTVDGSFGEQCDRGRAQRLDHRRAATRTAPTAPPGGSRPELGGILRQRRDLQRR